MKTSIRKRLGVGIRIKMVPTTCTIKYICVYPDYTEETQKILDTHRSNGTLSEMGGWYFISKYTEGTNTRMGIVREIVQIRSGSIKFSDGSWLDLQKASESEDTIDGFRVWDTDIETGVAINHIEYAFTDEPIDQEYHDRVQKNKEESARANAESYALTKKNQAEHTLKKKNIKTDTGIMSFLDYFNDQFANGSKWTVHAGCIQIYKPTGCYSSWRIAGFTKALAILFPDHHM